MNDYDRWAARYGDYYSSPAEMAEGYQDYLACRDGMSDIFAAEGM